jgi:dihydroflavonol-4-reductase
MSTSGKPSMEATAGNAGDHRFSDTGRSAVVFGATGFIGRWLVKELLDAGVSVTGVVRSEASGQMLRAWLTDHGSGNGLGIARADLTREDLGWGSGEGPVATEVYNTAGAYAFGMGIEEARAANVDTSRRIVRYAATLPDLVRLVHLSGYRVGGQDPAAVPWSEERVRREYRRLGAYEASKVESDAVVQAESIRLGVPWTIVNPSSVIGHSVTGESPQLLGLATTVLDLLDGRLPALPGSSSTFIPVVTVDYLATFTALMPTLPETVGRSYWVLDDSTPALPDLLRLIGQEHGVRVPRMRVPIALLRTLPRAVTKADPETLTFLSSDRYPVGPAEEVARAHGLRHPDVNDALLHWSRHLDSLRLQTRHATSARSAPASPTPRQ